MTVIVQEYTKTFGKIIYYVTGLQS